MKFWLGLITGMLLLLGIEILITPNIESAIEEWE